MLNRFHPNSNDLPACWFRHDIAWSIDGYSTKCRLIVRVSSVSISWHSSCRSARWRGAIDRANRIVQPGMILGVPSRLSYDAWFYVIYRYIHIYMLERSPGFVRLHVRFSRGLSDSCQMKSDKTSGSFWSRFWNSVENVLGYLRAN